MSVNKYMHPRNIYKTPPDFKKLALEFPEFRQFVKQELSGKVTFDFKNKEALRALSCTLLKKDFELEIEIPLNKLIPTIPLRLNYILWLEDLLSLYEKSDKIMGVDIGTGASCIYPLLASKKNGWFMLATEVDEESILCAKHNVDKNFLTNFVKIISVEESTLLKGVIKDENYDFCMCNPPFFGSTQELHPNFKARKLDRPKPKNSFCASVKEVVVKGGEVVFVSKLISESEELGKQIKIYTTMVGHKKNLPSLKSQLRQANVTSFRETEFCQGNTTRWGLAWTFCEDIDLKKCVDPIKHIIQANKPKKKIIFKLPIEGNEAKLNSIRENIVMLLTDLKMVLEDISRIGGSYKYNVRSFCNNWSNQRRKRREVLKACCESINSCSEHELSNSSVEDTESETIIQSPKKRENEDSLHGHVFKKLKISETDSNTDFFNFTISIKLESSAVVLELDCSVGNNREYLHQILQYIKNHLCVQTL